MTSQAKSCPNSRTCFFLQQPRDTVYFGHSRDIISQEHIVHRSAAHDVDFQKLKCISVRVSRQPKDRKHPHKEP